MKTLDCMYCIDGKMLFNKKVLINGIPADAWMCTDCGSTLIGQESLSHTYANSSNNSTGGLQ